MYDNEFETQKTKKKWAKDKIELQHIHVCCS